MTGTWLVNLNNLIKEKGEVFTKDYLSSFSCPLNDDVESFLKYKAMDFAVQGWAVTHLVLMSYKKEPVLVGYFTLADKSIAISDKHISKTTQRRLSKFALHDNALKGYRISAPLIAQLGKNYSCGYNKLITGDQLLYTACEKVRRIQFDLGGRFAYVECEDKPKLIEFYTRNGFIEFDSRKLDKDESNIHGHYLVQLLRYIR